MALLPFEQILFSQILRISSDVIGRYATMQDRLMYLVFIPHVVLLIFIWVFADTLSRFGGGVPHKGIRALVAIASYVFIVYSGWYGNLLVPIFVSLWQIILGLAIFTFVLSRFIHPARAREWFALGKVMGEKLTQKAKLRKKLEKEREKLLRMIREIERQPARTTEAMMYKEMQLTQLRARLAEIEHELEELG